jgi:nucleoside-diphosphate-sugar epimerase
MSSSIRKIITIVGGSGYLGKRCIQTLLNNFKDIKIYSISRNIELHNMNKYDDRVEQIKGDALNPDSFSPYLQKSTGVIHTVGKIISTEPPSSDLSYDKVNYESAMKIAKLANDLSSTSMAKKNFVYISAERGLVFPLSLCFSGYIDSKRKAEEKLLKDFSNLNPIILRPGLITDMKDRPYLYPLSVLFDIGHSIEKNVIDSLVPNLGKNLNLPAGSIELDTLALYATAGALGKLDEKIYSNDYMRDLNNMRNLRLDE